MMMSTELYVVTGVSGRTGAATARALLKAGKRVRVVVRESAKGNIWIDQGAEVAIADLTDISALSCALAGAEGAYILSPQQYARDDLFAQADIIASAIAEAANKARLPKLVALSSIGAEQASGTGWIAMNRILEQHLAQTGLNVTFLRAAYFMENWNPMVQITAAHGELFSFLAPLDRKLPMVATEDVGRIAAEALSEDWEGTRIIELEGPTMYSPNDVANHLAQAFKKTIPAVTIPESDWLQTLSGQGFSPAALAGFIEMTQSLNSRHIAFTDDPNMDHRKGTVSLDIIVTAMVASI
jgi:uncharacterized protein YbjT (DUF2867 family)